MSVDCLASCICVATHTLTATYIPLLLVLTHFQPVREEPLFWLALSLPARLPLTSLVCSCCVRPVVPPRRRSHTSPARIKCTSSRHFSRQTVDQFYLYRMIAICADHVTMTNQHSHPPPHRHMTASVSRGKPGLLRQLHHVRYLSSVVLLPIPPVDIPLFLCRW
jgi:hypothetical protein